MKDFKTNIYHQIWEKRVESSKDCPALLNKPRYNSKYKETAQISQRKSVLKKQTKKKIKQTNKQKHKKDPLTKE